LPTPPSRRTAIVAWIALLACAPGLARAGTRLDVTTEARFDDPPTLRLTVVDVGDADADDVVPEIHFLHRTVVGDAAHLTPGTQHEWRLALFAPPRPGTFAPTGRVRYVDALGERASVPVAALFATPGAPATAVGARLEVGAIGLASSGRVVLDNGGTDAIAGRVAFLLPDGLGTEPESLPAQVPGGRQTVVQFTVERRGGPPPGEYPVYALFEYTADAVQHAALARTIVRVAEGDDGRRARPLLVGGAALAIALALLAVAWRRSARR